MPIPAVGDEGAHRNPYDRAIDSYQRLGAKAYEIRIVKGKPTTLKVNPWQVSLLASSISDNFLAHFCGAVSIGGPWILTAAHCVHDRGENDLHVLWGVDNLGDPKGRRRAVVKVVPHEKYNDLNLDNDIALLKMDESIPGNGIEIMALADVDRLLELAEKGKMAPIWITGWGTIVEWGDRLPGLRGTTVPLQSYTLCTASDSYEGRISTAMICAGEVKGGTDACQADSGGPASVLASNGKRMLIGLISWGDGCAAAKKYGVYTKVSEFVDWIEQEKKKAP